MVMLIIPGAFLMTGGTALAFTSVVGGTFVFLAGVFLFIAGCIGD